MKPTFFISSTIYDFKDLRSSIKWWLEENQYKVNASEYNDFDKPLDDNSYESCLRAIDNSDYFILLIGDRLGGMYDDEISITQMEYRYAYQKMLEGKIKLINFVRHDTSVKMDEYKESIKWQVIVAKDLDKDKKNKHLLYLFIQEVRRVQEMKDGSKPKNNWVHQFNGFRDILDVLNGELGDRIGLNYKAKRFVIIEELISNLKSHLRLEKEFGAIPIGYISRELFKDFKVDFDQPMIELERPQQVNLGIFYISFWQSNKMRTSRIENFYSEGFFLEYDVKIDDYVSKDLNKLASSLLNFYSTLNSLHTRLYENYSEVIAKLSVNNGEKVKVSAALVVNAMQYCEALESCIEFSKNLYKKLNHLDYIVPIHQANLKIYPEGSLADKSEMANEKAIIELFTK